MDIKLPYGLRDGQLVTIDEVDRGLSCNCVCPTCNNKLIARKGDIKEHHFAHYKSEDCDKGIETATHIISKEFIKEAESIATPAIYFPRTKAIIFDEARVPIDDVILEKKLGSIVPDIVIRTKNKILLIEINVTHGVDWYKYNKIKELNLPVIEIFAGHLIKRMYSEKKYFLQDKDYRSELIDEVTNKRWVNNPRADRVIQRIKTELKQNYCEQKEIKYLSFDYDYLNYVDNCPLDKKIWKGGVNKGKTFANVDTDCEGCPFNIDIEYKTLKFKDGYKKDVPKRLFCAGYLDMDLTRLITKLKDQ